MARLTCMGNVWTGEYEMKSVGEENGARVGWC